MTFHGRAPQADPDIVGRTPELEAVDRFVADVAATADGVGAVGLLIEGEAGVGKSTLWRAAVDLARRQSIEVLTCTPAAVEQPLSFVALLDLIGGLADEDLDRLPPPQRTALDTALLRLPAGEAVDQGAVGVALTSLIARRAAHRPILLAIDDAQWLDRPSARSLSFAIRRLGEARIGVLLTRRTGEDAPFFDDAGGILSERARRLRLGPISFGAMHRLLATRTGHRFSRPVVVRIERASGRNPMAALEIARALLDAGVAELGPGEDLPVPRGLRDLLDARLARLSPGCRAALLIAASLSHPTLAVIAAASADSEAAERSLDEAEAAGIVELDGERVRFTHPLLSTVVQAAATSGARRAVHRRLGALVSSAEERAHHLALAATGPDAHLADQLEEAGLQTYRRGAPDVGAGWLARAQSLTPTTDLEARGRRAILEAEARMAAGDLAGTADVLERAIDWIPPGRLRAEAVLLLGTTYAYVDWPKTVPTLERALADAETAGDSTLHGRIHGRLAVFEEDVQARRSHGKAAIALIDPAVNPSALAFVMFGLFVDDVQAGQPPDLATFETALNLEPDVASWEVSTVPALWWKYTGEHDLARARLERHLQQARDSGDESSDADLYAHLAELELYDGRWSEADAAADRSVEAAEQMGQLTHNASHRVRALVDAHLGLLDRALDAAEAGIAASREVDPELEAMYLDVLGAARLAAGDPQFAADAFDRLRMLVAARGVQEPLRHRTEPDHIEALVAIGAIDRATEVLADLVRRHQTLPRPWITAALPRSRALVRLARGDPEGAADALATAVGAEAETWPPPDRPSWFGAARSLLVLGRMERQIARRRLAGERFDRAVALFDALPARAWAAQTRAEIDRLGRRRGAGRGLTPAEARVVELSAAGMTNRAVAERLVLSPKTVEAHLARAYAKLGVRSRAELGRRVGPAGGGPREDDDPAL